MRIDAWLAVMSAQLALSSRSEDDLDHRPVLSVARTVAAMDAATAGIVGAIVGSVVGGVAATAGSVVANRREITREQRIALYLDEVPVVLDQISRWVGSGATAIRHVEDADELIVQVGRRATVAGSSDAKRFDQVHAAKARLNELADAVEFEANAYGDRVPSDPDQVEAVRMQMLQCAAELVSFQAWLSSKIR